MAHPLLMHYEAILKDGTPAQRDQFVNSLDPYQKATLERAIEDRDELPSMLLFDTDPPLPPLEPPVVQDQVLVCDVPWRWCVGCKKEFIWRQEHSWDWCDECLAESGEKIGQIVIVCVDAFSEAFRKSGEALKLFAEAVAAIGAGFGTVDPRELTWRPAEHPWWKTPPRHVHERYVLKNGPWTGNRSDPDDWWMGIRQPWWQRR